MIKNVEWDTLKQLICDSFAAWNLFFLVVSLITSIYLIVQGSYMIATINLLVTCSLFCIIISFNRRRLIYYIHSIKLIIIFLIPEIFLFLYTLNTDNLVFKIILCIFINMILFSISFSFVQIVKNTILSLSVFQEKKFNYKYQYITYKKLFLITTMILLGCTYVVPFKTESSFYTYLFICLFIIIVILLSIIYYHSYYASKTHIFFNNINLDNNDILKKRIYLLSQKSKKYHIFKINFKDLFPENSTNHQIFIQHKRYYEFDNNVSTNGDYVFLSINKLKQNYKLKLNFRYTLNKKQYNIKCDIYLEIKVYGQAVYISKYILKNFRRILTSKENPLHFLKSKKFPIEYHVLNSIKYYNSAENPLQLDDFDYIYQDTRKWLFHDDKFGIGKTTIDINFAIKNGLQPIIISPWENNYDNDILQLIYHSLAKTTHSSWYAGLKNAYIFLVVSIAGFLIFLNNKFNYDLYNIIFKMLQTFIFSNIKTTINLNNYTSLSYTEFRTIFFLIISIILSIVFLPKVILFKKDNTKYYQDFYIKRIQSMFINNNKLFIIIEDIDRLDESVINNVFRIISLLNQQINNVSVIGLISLDSEITYNEKSIMSDTIKNKLVYAKISENYDFKISMKMYIRDGLIFLSTLDNRYKSSKLIRKIYTQIDNQEIKNFRDARIVLENEIKKYQNKQKKSKKF